MLQDYLPLVDEASLFDTTDMTFQICSFEKGGRVLQEPEMFTRFQDKARLNDDASCALELWAEEPALAQKMLLPIPPASAKLAALFKGEA